MRSNILELLVNCSTPSEAIRVIQTLEVLEFPTSPFTTPKFQGDYDNECFKLRCWVAAGFLPGVCPFGREFKNEKMLDEWFRDWDKGQGVNNSGRVIFQLHFSSALPISAGGLGIK